MITINGPINPAQLQAKLGGHGVLKVVGDPTGTGPIELSSDQYTDSELQSAVSSVSYDANYGQPQWKQDLRTLLASPTPYSTDQLSQIVTLLAHPLI